MSNAYSHLTADLAKDIPDASLNVRVGSFLLKGPYLVADPEPGLFGILVRYYASFNGLFSLKKSEELATKYIAGLSSMVVAFSDVEAVVHDVSDLSTYIHNKAESLRYNAGMAGACNDGVQTRLLWFGLPIKWGYLTAHQKMFRHLLKLWLNLKRWLIRNIKHI